MGRLDNEGEGQEQVLMHFIHDHALQLTKLLKTGQEICSACATCNFTLHRDCSELPRKIYHPSDSNHESILVLSPSFHCKACGNPGSGFSYNCNISLGDIHSLCSLKSLSATHDSHPHRLSLEFKPPYEGEEGFQCDICGRPGPDHWLYRCQRCDYDVHLHCSKSQAAPEVHSIIREKPAFEASSRALSLPNSPQKPAINTTSVNQSGKPQGFKQANVSGTIQQALASQNMATTTTTTQGPFNNTASRPVPIVTSQYRPNVACVYQSSRSSIRSRANGQGLDSTSGSGSGINQAICITPNRTMMNTTRGPINSSNPPVGATQHRSNVAYALRGTTFASGRQTYSSNGFVYLSSTQARNNLPICLGPNGRAPMLTVLQRNQGSTYAPLVRNEANQGGVNMVVGEVASGIGQAFGQEMFEDPTSGWNEGSMGSNHDGGTGIVGKALRKLILPW